MLPLCSSCPCIINIVNACKIFNFTMQQSDHEFNKHDRLNNNLVTFVFADTGTRMVNAISETPNMIVRGSRHLVLRRAFFDLYIEW